MLTKTTLSAIRALTHLGLASSEEPLSPRQIAAEIHESPTYLSKVMRQLVKAGILRAHRGVTGGVTFQRPPAEITLLAIAEACQGRILADFCQEAPDLRKTCGFHQAAAELHAAVVGVLSRWTLQHFLDKPRPRGMGEATISCWLEPVCAGRASLPAPVVGQAGRAKRAKVSGRGSR